MSKKSFENIKGEAGWVFALINGRLAEIWFEKGKGTAGIFAHGYVDRKSFMTIKEQKMIDSDIKTNRLSYRNKKYRRIE